jgi:hypothetical protein
MEEGIIRMLKKMNMTDSFGCGLSWNDTGTIYAFIDMKVVDNSLELHIKRWKPSENYLGDKKITIKEKKWFRGVPKRIQEGIWKTVRSAYKMTLENEKE